MSWSKADADAETVYTSQVEDYDGVQDDLMIVVERMLENKHDETKETSENILIYTNATNGYMRLAWYDPEIEDYAGKFLYYLELPKLWENSLTHEDGSFHFDNQTHIGICCLLEEYLEDINIYTSNELRSTPEILYI